MYKSELTEVLSRLDLVSGGFISTLLHAVKEQQSELQAVLGALATSNEARMREANALFQDVLTKVSTSFLDISPTAAITELTDLAKRFDAIGDQFPQVKLLLRPGREALADLSGAYDVLLQNTKRTPRVSYLIGPAIALEAAYSHYNALKKIYAQAGDRATSNHASLIIELEGLDQLKAFSRFILFLDHLIDVAEDAVVDEVSFGVVRDSVRISSIESGSPIKIVLKGASKTLNFLLAMLRDLARTPYLSWSKHGNLIQAIETHKRMEDFGISDPVVIANVNEAMRRTSKVYADSFGEKPDFQIVVNGEHLGNEESQTTYINALPKPTGTYEPNKLEPPDGSTENSGTESSTE